MEPGQVWQLHTLGLMIWQLYLKCGRHVPTKLQQGEMPAVVLATKDYSNIDS